MCFIANLLNFCKSTSKAMARYQLPSTWIYVNFHTNPEASILIITWETIHFTLRLRAITHPPWKTPLRVVNFELVYQNIYCSLILILFYFLGLRAISSNLGHITSPHVINFYFKLWVGRQHWSEFVAIIKIEIQALLLKITVKDFKGPTF